MGFMLSSTSNGRMAPSGTHGCLVLCSHSVGVTICCSFLRARKKLFQRPHQILLHVLLTRTRSHAHFWVNHWQEECDYSDTSLSTLVLQVGWTFPRDLGWALWNNKQRWVYIRRKNVVIKFWIGSQKCHCIALKRNPWYQFIFLT